MDWKLKVTFSYNLFNSNPFLGLPCFPFPYFLDVFLGLLTSIDTWNYPNNTCKLGNLGRARRLFYRTHYNIFLKLCRNTKKTMLNFFFFFYNKQFSVTIRLYRIRTRTHIYINYQPRVPFVKSIF